MKKKYRLKGWVRRTLSILLVVVLTTAVLPDMGSVFVRADGAVVYTQAAAPTVDEANKRAIRRSITRWHGTNELLHQCIYL